MPLKDTLKKDLVDALKAHNQTQRSVVGMVMTAIKNRELDKRSKLSKEGVEPSELDAKSALTDDEVLQVISSEIKKRKDSVEQFTAGGRPELADKEQEEIGYLKGYMPEQMDEAELKTIIQKTIADLGVTDVKDMGKVMNAVMAQVKGKADGSAVSRITKELLV